jgi:hypothetical protein
MATVHAHARAADRPPPPKPEHTYSLVIFLTGVARCRVLSAFVCGEDHQSELLQAVGVCNDGPTSICSGLAPERSDLHH